MNGQRLTRREVLGLLGRATVLSGSLGLLGACAPASAPAPKEQPKAAQPTTAPAKPAESKPAEAAKPAEAKPAAQAPAAGGGQTNLLMWTHYAGKNFEVFQNLLTDFKKEYPNISLDVTQFGPGEIDNKFLAAVAGGQPPDIHHPPGRIPPEMAIGGALAPLDDFVKFPSDLLKAYNELIIFNGKHFGMPANGGLGAMAYNTQLFEQAGLDPTKLPDTWDELADAADKITKSGQGRWGAIFPNQPVALTTQTTWSFMMSNEAELVTPDGKEPAFNTDATVEVFQYFTDLTQTRKVSPVKTYGILETWNDYGTGNVGAVNLYPAWIENIKTFKFQTTTAMLPQKKKRGSQFAGNYFTLSAKSAGDSAKREGFARFVEWWARTENNVRWCSQTGAIPISQSVIDAPAYQEYLKQEPLVRPFVESVSFARPWPAVVGITGLLQVLSEAWEASILGTMKPKEAIERAEKRASEELKRAQAQFRS